MGNLESVDEVNVKTPEKEKETYETIELDIPVAEQSAGLEITPQVYSDEQTGETEETVEETVEETNEESVEETVEESNEETVENTVEEIVEENAMIEDNDNGAMEIDTN